MGSAVNTINQIEELLGSGARELLDYKANGIPKETLHLPGPDWVDRIYVPSDRPIPVWPSVRSNRRRSYAGTITRLRSVGW